MKTAILYSTSNGSTLRVVRKLHNLLDFPVDIFNVKELTAFPSGYSLILFFAPTYGDGELHDDMEEFLLNVTEDMKGRKFAICELGNYYGYDDFISGAMPIIRHQLLERNGVEFAEHLSLDSMPKKDWDTLERWCKLLNEKVANAG